MIDNEKKVSVVIFPGKRAKSMKRLRSADNQKSTRLPPPVLPAAIFDPEWLEEVDDDYRQVTLNVPKEDFPWIEYMTRTGQIGDNERRDRGKVVRVSMSDGE